MCFWIRHQHWTSRESGGTQRPLVKVKYGGTIDLLQQWKQDKDSWTSDNKEPEYTPLTLDTATATKVFGKVKSILAQVRGMTGVLLMYVIRVVLIPEDVKDDPPPLGWKTSSIPLLTWRRWPMLLSSLTTLITRKNLRPSRPMERLFLPSSLTPRRFGPFSLHVLAYQGCGNT